MNRLSPVAKVLIALVAIWIALGIVGFVIRGLFVLFIVALIAFGFTLGAGARRNGFLRRR